MIWTLLPVSLIYGLAAALVFRRFSDQESIRETVNRMMAHMMEFRLFLDSPALVFGAQRDLLRENLRLLRLTLLPCAILAVLFIILFPQLDAMYGHAPLPVGEPSVVTVPLDSGAVLEAPAGIEIETPGVHVIRDRQVSWRVRPLGRTAGELKVRYDGRVVTRQIVAGGGLIYGWKLPFSSPAIEIRYPRTAVLCANWMVWFFLISSAVAIGYRQ
jgi:uncharacterized membrane protein (DUF106 family)